MILYGRNLSPFTRRVLIWCRMQGRAVEQRPLAATEPADAEAIRAVNPVGRVPTLVLEDGTALTESFAICDWLEETAPEGKRLIPASGTARRDCMQRIATAHSTTEKMVAMVYEKNRRPEEHQWPAWQERLKGQIQGGLATMEAAAPETGFHGGAAPDGSDIAVVAAWQFCALTNPWLTEPGYPRLAALVERAMALPDFAETKPG